MCVPLCATVLQTTELNSKRTPKIVYIGILIKLLLFDNVEGMYSVVTGETKYICIKCISISICKCMCVYVSFKLCI